LTRWAGGLLGRRVSAALFCHSRGGFPTVLLLLLAMLSDALAAEPFAAVEPGYEMVFPADHGAHPQFRTEWWYFTGFLQLDSDPSPVGLRSFQITFFRYRPPPGAWSENPSGFVPTQMIMAHAAMGVPATGQFEHWHRLGRVGMGLAHADSTRLDVAIQDWSLIADGAGWRSVIVLDGQRWELHFALPEGRPVLHGDNGVSAKGAVAGQASYYYSYPLLGVAGELSGEGDAGGSVQGRAWMDHEWSSEALDPDARGWDWLGLRLDDGSALMLYRFRNLDGGQRFIGGSWIAADGRVRPLSANDVVMTPLKMSWHSPRTGADYPLAWRVEVPGAALRVEALFPQQEMVPPVGPRYWEGAVRVSGDLGGEGFLEMTGYAATGGTPTSGP